MPDEIPYIDSDKARQWKEERQWIVGLATVGQFDNIPDDAFKVLKFDDKHVNVMHYLEDGRTGTQIGSPPRSMLLAFFGLFRDRLNEILDMEKAQGSGGGFYFFTVIDCECGSVSAIFAMMEWWCDGLKTLPAYRQDRQFAGLSHLYEAAKMLQVPGAMFEVIEKRLGQVIEIPTAEDLAEVYEDFPKDHDARQYTLDAWMGGSACRVNKEDNIDQLFDGDPELLQDVKDAISDLGSIRIVMVQATRCRR